MSELISYFQAYLQFNLSRIEWILILGSLLFLLFCFLQIKGYAGSMICGIMLSVNCSFILVMTLFGRLKGNYGLGIIPLESYCKAFSENNAELILQLIMNVVMYIPIGFLLPCCFKIFEKGRYVLLVTFAFSGSIELVQGLFEIGYFEVDDIINNTLGAGIGVLIYISYIKLRKRFNKVTTSNDETNHQEDT